MRKDLTLLRELPDGLPSTLFARDARGAPRYFNLLPRSERSYRRWLGKKIRRMTGFDGQDAEVIERYLRSRRIRRLRRDLIEEGFSWFRRAFPPATEPADLYDQDIGGFCHALTCTMVRVT